MWLQHEGHESSDSERILARQILPLIQRSPHHTSPLPHTYGRVGNSNLQTPLKGIQSLAVKASHGSRHVKCGRAMCRDQGREVQEDVGQVLDKTYWTQNSEASAHSAWSGLPGPR